MNAVELANAIIAAAKLLEHLIRIAEDDPAVWHSVKADYEAAVAKFKEATKQ